MKRLLVLGLFAAFAVFAWLSLPTPPQPDSGRRRGEPAALSEHGPLLNLGMPPMTMGFQVQDAASLERIKPGDKVRFHADATGGVFTVTKIEAANWRYFLSLPQSSSSRA